jgi:hypothetical protein
MTLWHQMIMSLDTYWPHDASHYSKVVDKRAECLNPWHRSSLSLGAGEDASRPLHVSPEVLHDCLRTDETTSCHLLSSMGFIVTFYDTFLGLTGLLLRCFAAVSRLGSGIC